MGARFVYFLKIAFRLLSIYNNGSTSRRTIEKNILLASIFPLFIVILCMRKNSHIRQIQSPDLRMFHIIAECLCRKHKFMLIFKFTLLPLRHILHNQNLPSYVLYRKIPLLLYILFVFISFFLIDLTYKNMDQIVFNQNAKLNLDFLRLFFVSPTKLDCKK